MRRTLTAVLPLLALTAACTTSTTASSSTAETTSGPPSSAEATTSAAAGIPPKPDAATQAAYIADLEAINPDIVHGKPDKAVSRGRDQCSSVANAPSEQAKLVDLTTKRFISPDHPNGFGPDASTRILAVVRKHICPTY